ncbi:MAG: DUF6174 domain-containing protein [Treponema sp.]|nr:DUF6174 domain-containing protein [Treponema sp.]
MKSIKYIVILPLCLLIGSCPVEGSGLDIDIGDYEYHLEAWDRQNLSDYQLNETYWENYPTYALVTVKNGIPECGDPYWLVDSRESTIPEFYAFIKKEEKRVRDAYNGINHCYLNVQYNTEYHYPSKITSKVSSLFTGFSREWIIGLMPLVEGGLEIDIGDYENQLAAWNSQNMLDYKLEERYSNGDYTDNGPYLIEIFNVKNDIPNPSDSFSAFSNTRTISEIYAFIKEEEKRIRNTYNGINRSYLSVQYDTEYHYPVQITSGVGHLFGRYWRWNITLTPLGKSERRVIP